MFSKSLLVVFLGVVVLATPSTSRPLFSDLEFNREAVKQLYVQAEEVVDASNGETDKRHLSPLPSKTWEDESAAARQAVRSYLDEALSPSETTDVDAEVGKYFDALPPSATWGFGENVVNYGDFASSPSDNAVQAENELEKYEQTGDGGVESFNNNGQEVFAVYLNHQADKSLEPGKQSSVDLEAEKYHLISLTPAERLEDEKEDAAEIEAEAQTSF